MLKPKITKIQVSICIYPVYSDWVFILIYFRLSSLLLLVCSVHYIFNIFICNALFVCVLLIDCVFGTAWVVLLSHNSWCYCAPGQIIFNPSEQECMMNRLANLLIFTDTHIVSHRSSSQYNIQKLEVCAQRNVPAKRFKICYILCIRKPV